MPQNHRITLDKVERQKCAELKEIVPEYETLDIDEIAHWELKNALLKRTTKQAKNIWKKESLKNEDEIQIPSRERVNPPSLNGSTGILISNKKEVYCQVGSQYIHIKRNNPPCDSHTNNAYLKLKTEQSEQKNERQNTK